MRDLLIDYDWKHPYSNDHCDMHRAVQTTGPTPPMGVRDLLEPGFVLRDWCILESSFQPGSESVVVAALPQWARVKNSALQTAGVGPAKNEIKEERGLHTPVFHPYSAAPLHGLTCLPVGSGRLVFRKRSPACVGCGANVNLAPSQRKSENGLQLHRPFQGGGEGRLP